MSESGKLGDFSVGDTVWFVLKDGLSRMGRVVGFFEKEGFDTAIDVYDSTDQKHRFMTGEQLSKKPIEDVKKKTRRKVREKKTRRSTKVF